jgi:hypothetical protein
MSTLRQDIAACAQRAADENEHEIVQILRTAQTKLDDRMQAELSNLMALVSGNDEQVAALGKVQRLL